MYDAVRSSDFLRLCAGVLRDARRLGNYFACVSSGAYHFARAVPHQAISIIALIVVIASLPVPAAGQSVLPPQPCAGGWREFAEFSRSSNNYASTGNDYGRAGLFPVDNEFVMPSGAFVIAVREIERRQPYSPTVNVFAGVSVNVGSGLAGAGTFAYSGVLSGGGGTLRVQSQFVRYSIWYCPASLPTPTYTPTPTHTPTPISTPSSAGFQVCLPPPTPPSRPATTPTPCSGALCGVDFSTGLATPTATRTPLPTVCVDVFAVTPLALTPIVPVSMQPDVRPVAVSGGFLYRDCYDIWPGFELDFSNIPFLSGLGVWSSPPFGVCVSYYSFSIAYDGRNLMDYLGPAIAFAGALVVFYYYRRG